MMSLRDTTLWAREELVDAMDAAIKRIDAESDPDLDDLNALITQRNRAAKFLGQPSKRRVEILTNETTA